MNDLKSENEFNENNVNDAVQTGDDTVKNALINSPPPTEDTTPDKEASRDSSGGEAKAEDLQVITGGEDITDDLANSKSDEDVAESVDIEDVEQLQFFDNDTSLSSEDTSLEELSADSSDNVSESAYTEVAHAETEATLESTADDDETILESSDIDNEANVDSANDEAYHIAEKSTDITKDVNERGKKNDESKIGNRLIDSLFDFIELFIFSLAAVFIITTFFFRHSVVDGSSMERTLFDGEHIIISDLFYKPERGDIVVCEDYSVEDEDMRKPIVKRVIAIAGDTVEIDEFGNVKVNGVLIDESEYIYISPDRPYFSEPYTQTIKEGEVFVMGDHRNWSKDSRAVGPIKEDSILGKVLFRFYPFEKFGAVE